MITTGPVIITFVPFLKYSSLSLIVNLYNVFYVVNCLKLNLGTKITV